MKEYLRLALYSILSLINRIVPKKKRIVVYGGHELNDNSETMFRYLLENTPYKIICIADVHMQYPKNDRVLFIHNSNWNAAKYMLSSVVVIDSSFHTIKMHPTKKQLFLQFWHGSPLKKMEPSSAVVKNGSYYTWCYYAHEIFKKSLEYALSASNKNMLLAGNPRNDDLFVKKANNLFFGESSKTIIWMPTYRHGLNHSLTTNDIPVINKDNAEELNSLLSNLNINLYIKPHPVQIKSLKSQIGENLSNIVFIENSDIFAAGLSLYQFLGMCDALITDYSSVYYDYLLIDKPIGFAIDDIDEYNKSQGFVFDDPLEYMPGMYIYNIEDLKQFFEDLSLGRDNFSDDRHRVNDAVNYYKDNQNCYRAALLIKKALN